MTVRAVLFDMDGVLIDSFEMWFETMNAVARRFEAPAISREALRAAFGQGVEEDVRTFYRGVDIPTLNAAYDEEMPQFVDRIRPNPTAPAALAALEQRGIARAVVTNTQRSVVDGILTRCGLRSGIDHISAVAPGLREKPHPDLLRHALDHFDVPREAALMVGDTEVYDGAAARAAGVPFLFYDLRDGTDLAKALAHR